MTNLLFTTPTCPNCPAAKVFLDVSGLDFELVDASKPEGLNLARKYGVGSVPTLVVVDDKGSMTDSAYGLDDIEALVEK
jgi:ribonucleoside-triphosphate reductase (formate)